MLKFELHHIFDMESRSHYVYLWFMQFIPQTQPIS